MKMFSFLPFPRHLLGRIRVLKRRQRPSPLARCVSASLLALIPTTQVHALDGTWSGAAGTGLWSQAGNWQTDIADGADFTATFGSVDITGLQTVQLDSPRTIGNLVFGDLDVATPG